MRCPAFVFGFLLACTPQSGPLTQDPDNPHPDGSSAALDSAMRPLDTGSHSGSRIQLRTRSTVYDGADGAHAVGFYTSPVMYDTALKTDCFPRQAGGKLRCLPSTTASVSAYFLDSACTQSLAVLPCGTTPIPKFALATVTATACLAQDYDVLSIGDPVTPAPTSIYTTSGGGCNKLGFSLPYIFLPVVSKMSPDQFVELTMTTVDSAPLPQ